MIKCIRTVLPAFALQINSSAGAGGGGRALVAAVTALRGFMRLGVIAGYVRTSRLLKDQRSSSEAFTSKLQEEGGLGYE